jgi:hypothetical protein
LTAADLYDPVTRIHGPRNLAHFLATFRNYIFRTNLDLSTNEFGDVPTPYKDERVTVTPIPLTTNARPVKPHGPSFSFADQFHYYSPPLEGTPQELLARKKDIVHEMFKLGVYEEAADNQSYRGLNDEDRRRRTSLINQNLPPTTPSDISMAYLITNHGSPGKFNPEKAKALNIPLGRLYGQLKKGETVEFVVTAEDGTSERKVVKSEQVVEEPIPGKKVLILDIPGMAYVSKLLVNDALNSETVKSADLVVHMLANEVASAPDYIEWIQSFKSTSKVCPSSRSREVD